MAAQEAALKDIANNKPQHLHTHYQSFVCADVKVGDSAIFRNMQVGRVRAIGDARRRFWISSTLGSRPSIRAALSR